MSSSLFYNLTSPTANDAFGRYRMSEPETLFDSKLVIDANPRLWITDLNGTGLATYDGNSSSVALTAPAASDHAIRQSKLLAIYQPGKSLQLLMTGILGAPTANAVKRFGLFDDDDGHFIEANATEVRLVRRSSVTGSTVDTPVAQSSWSYDPMDGTGPSGVTLDWTKPQIMFLDQEWLGVGKVRIGFVVAGAIYIAHEFLFSNTGTTPTYFANPNLPQRYEIVATGANAATLTQVCGSVSSEGGFTIRGFPVSYGSASRNVNGSGNSIELCALRLNSTYAAKALIVPELIGVLAPSNPSAEWRLLLNQTGSSGGTWLTPSTNSLAQVNVTRTGTPSGGVELARGYLASANDAPAIPTDSIVALGRADLAGAMDTLSLQIINRQGGNNNYYGAMNWREVY